MTSLQLGSRLVLAAVVSMLSSGCGPPEDDSRFRAVRPDMVIAPEVLHAHGEHGGHEVSLQRDAGVRAEVVVDEERQLAVYFRFEPGIDLVSLGEVRVTLEHEGDKTSYDLVAGGEQGRFDLQGDLPESIRSVEDVVGELAVELDGATYTGSLAEHLEAHDHGASTAHAHHEGTGTAATTGTTVVLVVYCLLVVAASLFGGWLPSLIALTHDRMQSAMSVVGGLMLGIAVFHLLPHGVHELGGPGAVERASAWTMAGLVAMFLLLRTFHFHQHGPGDRPVEAGHDHGHDGTPPSHGQDPGQPHADGPHGLSWVGVFLGLSVHTLIDGIALAASVESDARHGHEIPLYGLGTFLAVLLHKPLDAVSITTLMSAGGWTSRHRNLVNLAYAATCPLGAFGFVLGVGQLGEMQHVVLGCSLCFAAGVFLCISLGDVLPEMEFHAHNRVRLTLLLLVGIGLAWAIGFLEPAHVHAH